MTKIKPLGTLWSLYREQNNVHGRIIEAVEKGMKPYCDLPKPFETVIPNATAIAEATEPGQSPKSFTAKYSPKFSRLFRSLCDEIAQRSQWSEASTVDKSAVLKSTGSPANSQKCDGIMSPLAVLMYVELDVGNQRRSTATENGAKYLKCRCTAFGNHQIDKLNDVMRDRKTAP